MKDLVMRHPMSALAAAIFTFLMAWRSPKPSGRGGASIERRHPGNDSQDPNDNPGRRRGDDIGGEGGGSN
jgi:hypothetical protein